MRSAASSGRLTALVLVGATLAIGGGLTSLGMGLHCFTQEDPDATCGVLAAAVPMMALPLGGGLALLGLGLTGRLVRNRDEGETAEGP